MTRWIGPQEAGRLLKPGMTVFVGGATSEPLEILNALSQQGECCQGVRFISVSLPGINHVDFCSFHPEASSVAFFATKANHASLDSGKAEFMRLRYSEIFEFLCSGVEIDMALVQLPPFQPGEAVSLGLCADFLPAVLDKAGLVTAEINSRQPVPVDAPTMSADRLDYAVFCDREIPEIIATAISEQAREIGRLIAREVEDGSCLQVGIGTIPNSVLSALGERNDLGIHSGMIPESVMDLAKTGNITGINKPVDTGKMVTGVVLGSEALVRWAGAEQDMRIRPVSYTHDPQLIRQLDRFVSINSALEVDLSGRVNAESISGRRVSGPGGMVDMMRGAALSPGGKSFIALNSTARGGQVSTIVPFLHTDTPATAPASDVDYVVTEYGCRRIGGLPAEARAQALIEISHPGFRDQLRDRLNYGKLQ